MTPVRCIRVLRYIYDVLGGYVSATGTLSNEGLRFRMYHPDLSYRNSDD